MEELLKFLIRLLWYIDMNTIFFNIVFMIVSIMIML